MRALRRVLEAPGLWIGWWATTLAIAAAFGWLFEGAVDDALGGARPPADGHLLLAFEQMGFDHPELPGLLFACAGMIGVVTWVASTIAAPLFIARLGGRSFTDAAGLWVQTIKPCIAVTLWHTGIRLLALLALWIASVNAWGTLIAFALALGLCSAALDVARIRVVHDGAHTMHPKAALHGFLEVVRLPGLLAKIAALWALQAVAIVAIAGLGWWCLGSSAAPWVARGGALLAIFAGFWRLAVAIEHLECGGERPPTASAAG